MQNIRIINTSFNYLINMYENLGTVFCPHVPKMTAYPIRIAETSKPGIIRINKIPVSANFRFTKNCGSTSIFLKKNTYIKQQPKPIVK